MLARCALALGVIGGSTLAAQQPAPGPRRPAVAAEKPATQEGYSYNPHGRRDPFVGPANRLDQPSKKKPEGLRGFSFVEIVLRGIVQGRAGAVALVLGPDGRTYIVHVGDQLYDGVVKAITADSLVVQQEVTDPLSLAKQREVRKTLRAVEEVK